MYVSVAQKNYAVKAIFFHSKSMYLKERSMQNVIDNYQKLKALWEWSLEEYKESEPKIRIEGVQLSSNEEVRLLFWFNIRRSNFKACGFLKYHAPNEGSFSIRSSRTRQDDRKDP